MPKIKEVVVDPDRPVFVEFQNGKIQPGEEESLNSALLQNKRAKMVGVANSEMVYSGDVVQDTNYNSFFIVQTEGSKDLQLIQIDTCTVAPLLDKTSAIPTSTTSQTVGDLQKQFGSKKAKRYTEQQERLKMNLENVKEDLEKTVADISVSEITTSMREETESLYRPKINRQAQTREQVYQLEDLVPEDVLNSLEETVSEMLETEDLKETGLISSVQDIMAQLRSSLPELVVIQKCKILLYVHYLVKFMNTPMKTMTKKFVVCDCSDEVDKHIKMNYTINGLRPLGMRDKGLCYTIVLLMLAKDFELDLEPISKDLKTGVKKMQEFARNLGFSMSPKNKNSIVLKIPVPPPVMPNLKRKSI